jgi:hypothetical protein
MTVSMFRAYVDAMPELYAEESARLAEAFSVPHMPPDSRKDWWETIYDRIRGTADAVAEKFFTFNGRWLSGGRLKEKFSDTFGDASRSQ